MQLVRVVVATHLRRTFDYLIPDDQELPAIGARLEVPFGQRRLIAIAIEHPQHSDIAADKLRPIGQRLDPCPLLPAPIHKLLLWSAQYYHYSLGDVYLQALPTLLRQGQPAQKVPKKYWQITEQGKTRLRQLARTSKAPRQKQVLEQLQQVALFPHEQWSSLEITPAVLNTMQSQHWIEPVTQMPKSHPWQWRDLAQQPHQLNSQQAVAVAAITHRSAPFTPFLLEGVTGSGKTEVYLQVLEPLLKSGKQALILVPEIGLTPQTIDRFRRRFELPLAVLHSGMNDRQRLDAWLQAKNGEVAIVIGTRSALFTPLQNPGIIIIDEEHDSSFKQQDTFRYHARDVALMRAKLEQIPIVMGTATPALESLHNALSGRYHYLQLSQRAGNAQPAHHQLLDIKNQPLRAGLSPQLLQAMQQTLKNGQQVMLFLNRRGYAPALLCHECGEVVECPRCERFYTVHQQPAHLACHHCGSQRPIPQQCQHCGSTQLVTTGLGTEQLEQELKQLFSDYAIARIDRDSTRRKGALETMLKAINANEYQILIGTQMLAKGHHFPNVTLVAIIDIDHALFSSDFRAAERLAQLFIQVAGRAGRAGLKGTVMLQTHHPEHELLQDLINNGYTHFAQFALRERQQTELPPFSYQALIRFETSHSEKIQQFSEQLEAFERSLSDHQCWIFPVTESALPKRAGKLRMQQLLQAHQRVRLHQLLHHLAHWLENTPCAQRVRWSIDVDPIDML
ncbi:primosomal protein N' [Celerinatantimonas sp. YJH-8]|uniref:primosomal protein N' n=1 Tax=Celerinatantimonas sp. YJH-8 TaxID=3228714 RepID=UPI0038C41218